MAAAWAVRLRALPTAHGGLAQHLRIFLGIPLLSRSEHDPHAEIGDQAARCVGAIDRLQLRNRLDHDHDADAIAGHPAHGHRHDLHPAQRGELVEHEHALVFQFWVVLGQLAAIEFDRLLEEQIQHPFGFDQFGRTDADVDGLDGLAQLAQVEIVCAGRRVHNRVAENVQRCQRRFDGGRERLRSQADQVVQASPRMRTERGLLEQFDQVLLHRLTGFEVCAGEQPIDAPKCGQARFKCSPLLGSIIVKQAFAGSHKGLAAHCRPERILAAHLLVQRGGDGDDVAVTMVRVQAHVAQWIPTMRAAVITERIEHIHLAVFGALAGGFFPCLALDVQDHRRLQPCQQVRNDHAHALAATGTGRQQQVLGLADADETATEATGNQSTRIVLQHIVPGQIAAARPARIAIQLLRLRPQHGIHHEEVEHDRQAEAADARQLDFRRIRVPRRLIDHLPIAPIGQQLDLCMLSEQGQHQKAGQIQPSDGNGQQRDDGGNAFGTRIH